MKIYVFGSNGMLGRYISVRLYSSFEVICIDRNKYEILTDHFDKLNILLQNVSENDVIINCCGIIPQKYEYTKIREYIKINTLFPHKLQEFSEKHCCKFIHITTDCVFSGKSGDYTPEDIHDADNIYAVSKSLGESENATIIRTSIIGEELVGKKSLIEWIKSNKNGKIKGYTNHLWNGVTCLELANIIEKIISESLFWKGVKHICSPNKVSKYDLCTYVNDIYSLNIDIISCEDIHSKNMTLSNESDNKTNIISMDSIYTQIQKQYQFTLNH